jgi:hypothetical protein
LYNEDRLVDFGISMIANIFEGGPFPEIGFNATLYSFPKIEALSPLSHPDINLGGARLAKVSNYLLTSLKIYGKITTQAFQKICGPNHTIARGIKIPNCPARIQIA